MIHSTFKLSKDFNELIFNFYYLFIFNNKYFHFLFKFKKKLSNQLVCVCIYIRGASDAAEITEGICFHSGEILFLLTATVFAVTVAATVTCPPAFLGYCRNSELLLLFTVRVLFMSVAGADE